MPFVVRNKRTLEYYPYSKYPRKGLAKTDLECAKVYPTRAGANQRRAMEAEHSKWTKLYYSKHGLPLPVLDEWEIINLESEKSKDLVSPDIEKRVKEVAYALWSVHPKTVTDLGLTRLQYYEMKIRELIDEIKAQVPVPEVQG